MPCNSCIFGVYHHLTCINSQILLKIVVTREILTISRHHWPFREAVTSSGWAGSSCSKTSMKYFHQYQLTVLARLSRLMITCAVIWIRLPQRSLWSLFLLVPESSSVLSCSVFHSTLSVTGTGGSFDNLVELEDEVKRRPRGNSANPITQAPSFQ